MQSNMLNGQLFRFQFSLETTLPIRKLNECQRCLWKKESNYLTDKVMLKKARTHNTGLTKVAVQCSSDTYLVNQNFVLRINICVENRHLRQARNRKRSL